MIGAFVQDQIGAIAARQDVFDQIVVVDRAPNGVGDVDRTQAGALAAGGIRAESLCNLLSVEPEVYGAACVIDPHNGAVTLDGASRGIKVLLSGIVKTDQQHLCAGALCTNIGAHIKAAAGVVPRLGVASYAENVVVAVGAAVAVVAGEGEVHVQDQHGIGGCGEPGALVEGVPAAAGVHVGNQNGFVEKNPALCGQQPFHDGHVVDAPGGKLKPGGLADAVGQGEGRRRDPGLETDVVRRGFTVLCGAQGEREGRGCGLGEVIKGARGQLKAAAGRYLADDLLCGCGAELFHGLFELCHPCLQFGAAVFARWGPG